VAAAAAGAEVVNGVKVGPTGDLAPAVIGCFTPCTGHVWGRASGTWNQLDGDNDAPGYDETQASFTVGADYAFTESFYTDIVGGWISSEWPKSYRSGHQPGSRPSRQNLYSPDR